MWYHSYTNIWFNAVAERVASAGVPLDRAYFAMVLMQELHTDLRDFLSNHYADLHSASSIPLQIFAPVKPPRSIYDDSFGPENPIADSHDERQSFFESIKQSGVALRDMPKLLFFSLKPVDDESHEFADVCSLPLGTVEYGQPTGYKRFFSELINISIDSYHAGDTPEEFYSKVTLRFRIRFFEEKIREMPVIGGLYRKRVG